MIKFAIQKSLSFVLLIIGVSIFNTLIIAFIPGDPAVAMLGERATPEARNQIREKLGLNEPLPVQVKKNLFSLISLELGTSIRSNRSVGEEILSAMPVSLFLGFLSAFFTILNSILSTFYVMKHKNSYFEKFMNALVVSLQTVPIFVLALISILLLGVYLNIVPISGVGRAGESFNFFSYFWHLLTPSLVLSLFPTCMLFRLLRASCRAEEKLDYIKVARAKGLSENKVILRHIFPNSLISSVTVFGVYFSLLIGGAVLTETVFALPGLGRLMLDSVLSRDIPMVQACLALVLLMIFLFNLAIDSLLVFIDPRRRTA